MAGPAPANDLIEPLVLWYEHLPQALDGLRILHLSDLHVRDARPRHEQILQAGAGATYDLLALTGDYMHHPGDEPAAHELMLRLCRAARPRLATLAITGNHDTPRLREQLAELPLRWLDDAAWAADALPLTVLGLACDGAKRGGDLLAAALDAAEPDPSRFTLLLAHSPNWLPAAADLGVDLVLAGHTHGGQIRLPGKRMLVNKLDWPLSMSTGVLRLGKTRAVVSRGLGEGLADNLRFGATPHIPLITLGRGACEMEDTQTIEVMHRW